MIKKSCALLSALLLGIAFVPVTFAADGGLTLIVIDDGVTPSEVVNMIPLPDSASDTGHEQSGFGRETAYDARNMGDDPGDFGQQMSLEARAHMRDALRRDAGRRPDDTGRPDNPGRPEE